MVAISHNFPNYQFVVAAVPWIEKEMYDKVLANTGVKFVCNKTYDTLFYAETAIVTSGTATLETALIGTPEIVMYHVPKIYEWLRPIVLKIPYISLVNINLNRECVREIVVSKIDVEAVCRELRSILKGGNSRKKMLADFPISPVMVVLKQLIDRYLLLPQIDKKRVYIIGISMGAMGVYDITVRYPEIFAAAIPICGIVNPKRLEAAKGVKFRLFHGSADNIVPPSGSRRAYKALKKAGAEVQYNEFPGVGHESWKQAFELPDFMKWLFFQKKE
jgi:hypothetical protein